MTSIKPKKEFRIFYSWQSDSPKTTNLNAIRGTLKLAIENLNSVNTDIKLIADEATRDTSGSPNIADKILEKIELADMFIADMTTITSPESKRACPNPNVTYELGYAVGQLGWDRIVLLFNEAYGQFPKDLPFDLIQQRASPYFLKEGDLKASQNNLTKLLEVAIKAVIDKNPKTPIELRGLSREKLEHDRDVENLEWLMSHVHIPTLDLHLDELPRVIDDRIFFFWEGFKGVFTSSLFSLYDQTMNTAINVLFDSWYTTLNFADHYRDTPSGRRHVFSNPGDAPLNSEQQLAWEDIENAQLEMAKALKNILSRLRENYIEVNLQKTNSKAWDEYVKIEKMNPTKLV